MPAPFPDLDNKNILLITEAFYGSGDFFAAKKLIILLNEVCENIQISWQIRTLPERLEAVKRNVAELSACSYFNNTSVVLRKEEINPQAHQAHQLILFFPTVHDLSSSNFQILKSLQVPLLQVHEYDALPRYHTLPNKAQLVAVNAGFDGLGLFLDFQKARQAVLPLEEVLSEDFCLDPAHELFFAYSSHEKSSRINGVDLDCFLQVLLEIADPQKSIDFVANFKTIPTDSAFYNSIWEHGFSEIEVLVHHGEGQCSKSHRVAPGKVNVGSRTLRIMAPFPLANQQMISLMAHAHPVQLVTGDQSLTELISQSSADKGVFPFYEILIWKQGLSKNLCETARHYLGEASHYLKLFELVANSRPLNPQQFGDYWRENKEKILEESQRFHQHLAKNKDLNLNFPKYLNLLFEISRIFSYECFEQHAKLLVQLLIKLDAIDEMIPIISKLNSELEETDSFAVSNALTEFLKMTPFEISMPQIMTLIQQLLEIKKEERVFFARNARQIILTLPLSLQNAWLLRILPDLSGLPSAIHASLIRQIQSIPNIDLFVQQCEDWFKQQIKIYLNPADGYHKTRLEQCKNNSLPWENRSKQLLLAVNMYNDGLGDLSKYIAIYHELCRSFPGIVIDSLIKCKDDQRATILGMLRESAIDMRNVYVWSLDNLTYSELANEQYTRHEIARLLRKQGCGQLENRAYDLIITVATYFPEIHSTLRQGGNEGVPFLEIGEVQLCSHKPTITSPLQHDLNHKLVAMGVNDMAVGLEIMPYLESDPHDIFSKLPADVASALLDSTISRERIDHFVSSCFFMPAYLKNEQGIFSIYYALMLFENHYKDKDEIVIWVHQLPFDVKNKAFHRELHERGIGHLIIHSLQGQRDACLTGDNGSRSSGKVLRLVHGLVNTTTFDYLFNLAQYTGKFAGCVGQNSFERALSNHLIPAFMTPYWQVSIIREFQEILPYIFKSGSLELSVVMDYLQLLSDLSESIRLDQEMLEHLLFSIHRERLKPLPPKVRQAEILEIIEQEKALLNKTILGMNTNTSEQAIKQQAERVMLLQSLSKYQLEHKISALEQLESSLPKIDLALLQRAWEQVCSYVQRHKNLNNWLVNEVSILIQSMPSRHPFSPEPEWQDQPTKERHLYDKILSRLNPKQQGKTIVGYLTNSAVNYLAILTEKERIQICISHQSLAAFDIEELIIAIQAALNSLRTYPAPSTQFNLRELINKCSNQKLSRIVDCNQRKVKITGNNMPNTRRFLDEQLTTIWPGYKKARIQFFLGDEGSYLQPISNRDKPSILINKNTFATLTLGQFCFGLEYVAHIFTHCLAEDANFSLSHSVNKSTALESCSDELLIHGIPYCRQQIAQIEERLARLSSMNPSVASFKLKGEREFYGDLIKIIEASLAQKNLYKLASTSSKVNDRWFQPIDDEIVMESRRYCTHWQIEEEAPPLDELIAKLPELTIKDLWEFEHPPTHVQIFIRQLHKITAPQTRERLYELIDLAFQHRILCFDELYFWVAAQIDPVGETMPILGPFQLLKGLIEAFSAAESLQKAQAAAADIEDYFYSESRHLFHNRKFVKEVGFWDNGVRISSFASVVGSRIRWNQFFDFDNRAVADKHHYLDWSQNDASGNIARVLFRLGVVLEESIWDKLDFEFIKMITIKETTPFLGLVPPAYQEEEDTSGFNLPFSYSFAERFFQFKYNKMPVLELTTNNQQNESLADTSRESIKESPDCQLARLSEQCKQHVDRHAISAEFIRTYIKNNLELLAIVDKFPLSAKLLMLLMERLLADKCEEGQAFVQEFYLDSDSPIGLYAILQKRIALALYPIMSNDRFKIRARDGWESEYTAENTEEYPYIQFLIKHRPTYLPLAKLLDVLALTYSLDMHRWPLDYFTQSFGLELKKMSDIHPFMDQLFDLENLYAYPVTKGFSSGLILKIVITMIDQYKSLSLFSTETQNLILMAKSKNILVPCCHHLLERSDVCAQIQSGTYSSEECSVGYLASLYSIFDGSLLWPNTLIREQYTAIIRSVLLTVTQEEQLAVCELLLFKLEPLSDGLFAQQLIEQWAELESAKRGKDDQSYAYYSVLTRFIQQIIAKVPAIYQESMLNKLCININAQALICSHIREKIKPDDSTRQSLGGVVYVFIQLTKVANNARFNLDLVKFLTQSLTSENLEHFLSEANARYIREVGRYFNKNSGGMDKTNSKIIAVWCHHLFWDRALEERAIVINNLLIPSSVVHTEEAANRAYQEAFDFLASLLFPENNEDHRLSRALLLSYLSVAHKDTRPYLLAAIMTANQMKTDDSNHLYATLPKIAEALGAAGVKAGQAAHSYPRTPEAIRASLGHLKSQSRLPLRWGLWALVESRLPADLFKQIKTLNGVLGGASFYIAVAVEMMDGRNLVLRLMRQNAQKEAAHGFCHLQETIKACQYEGINEIKPDLEYIISDAQAGALSEISHGSVVRQYEIAGYLYNSQQETQRVKIANKIFKLCIQPVTLHDHGEGFQLISMAEGIEFNELKKDPAQQALCQAVALVVCKTELHNMLGGGFFDADRHGAQTRIHCQETSPNHYQVIITHYDFGEISINPASEFEQAHCRSFMTNQGAKILNTWNILRTYLNNDSSIPEQLSEAMLAYMRDNTSKLSELTRLRAMFKGMLALNDYIEVISSDRALMSELKQVFDEHLKPMKMTEKTTFLPNSSKDRKEKAASSSCPSFFPCAFL